MKNRLIAIAVGALALAGTAHAENTYTDRARKWDFSLQTRYTGSKDFDGEKGSTVHLNDDLGWGFEFGYNVNERLNIGFLTSWRSVSYNATTVDATDATDVVGYNSWLDTGTFALTGSYNILPKRFTPYVEGGIGWTMIDTNIPADYSTGCWYDPWWGYQCNTYVSTYGTDAASYGLGAGMRLEVNPQMFIRIGYEHDWLDVNNADGADVFRVDVGAIY